MTNPSEKLNEQVFLREELNTNKKLVFERAIAIVAVGLGATLISENHSLAHLLGLPTLVALAFNLWLTTNRLKSNARIIAYYQLFHEPQEKMFKWIGWENALRLHRIWSENSKKHTNKNLDQTTDIRQYDNLAFYGPIYLLHLSMAALVCAIISLNAWIKGPVPTPAGTLDSYAFPLVYFLSFLGFLLWSMFFRPKTFLDGIEQNLLDWESVFTAFEKKTLKPPTYAPIESSENDQNY